MRVTKGSATAAASCSAVETDSDAGAEAEAEVELGAEDWGGGRAGASPVLATVEKFSDTWASSFAVEKPERASERKGCEEKERAALIMIGHCGPCAQIVGGGFRTAAVFKSEKTRG